jgi:hypothetical protein
MFYKYFLRITRKIIQRKHFTIWTGIEPDKLAFQKEEVTGKLMRLEIKIQTNLF